MEIMSVAALGTLAAYGATSYEGTTFTQSKRCKTITSGLINIAYGIVVIILAYLFSTISKRPCWECKYA